MAIWRDLGEIAALGRGGKRSLCRASIELAIARMRLFSDGVRQRVGTDSGRCGTSPPLTPAQERLVDQVAFAIPRVAARLPWRADCMVQALAAERWLRRNGIDSHLVVGALRTGPSLEAHAWLEVGERVITGGDVSGFNRFAR